MSEPLIYLINVIIMIVGRMIFVWIDSEPMIDSGADCCTVVYSLLINFVVSANINKDCLLWFVFRKIENHPQVVFDLKTPQIF